MEGTPISKASKGVIRDSYSVNLSMDGKQSLLPPFSREKVLEAIRKDSTVLAAITTLVDKSLESKWRIYGIDKKSKQSANEEKLKELGFNKILRQIFYNLYAYNNVFIENVKNGNKEIKELHILETTTTEPIANPHGEVFGYRQVVLNGSNQSTSGNGDIEWSPEEVTHITINTLTTGIWGEIDIQSIWTSVLIKQYIHEYLGWLFGTNQLRGFFNIKQASDVQVSAFLSHMKSLESDIHKPLVAEGEVVYELLRTFDEGDSLLKVLEHCDNNIRTLLQVPPISLGQPDSSNRSNSDTQESSLYTRISSVHQLVEDAINFDLFKKIGFDKTRFIFNPINRMGVSRIIENALKLKELNMDENTLKEYLKLEGFPIDVSFNKMLEEPMGNNNDLDPSRRRKLKDETSKKIGSGANSTTRANQLISKARDPVEPIEEVYEDEVVRVVLRKHEDENAI